MVRGNNCCLIWDKVAIIQLMKTNRNKNLMLDPLIMKAKIIYLR